MRRITLPSTDDGSQLAARLIGCLPAASVEMETLCRLSGIKVSHAVPTAAVECVHRPRLLINPEFAEKYCQRDEHLFLLVMHELWHIILAHTRLYPRVTTAHNVAFDAIINAGLARQYDQPEFRGFFDTLNPADKFPHVLLRPPEGWPINPQYADVGPAGTRAILERLYPPPGARAVPMPFYSEILQLLWQYVEANGWVWVDGEPFLLGDHSSLDAGAKVFADPLLGDLMRRIADKLPQPGQRGPGSARHDQMEDVAAATERARRAFSQILLRCLGPRQGGQRRRSKMPISSLTGTGVLPNPRDRLASARRQLGVPGTIWNQMGTVRARLPEKPSKAHLYLDVSGSMADILPHLLGLVLPYVARGQVDVFQFSTIVEPLPFARLQNGYLQTTGGTDINCVLEHALAVEPMIHRALLLTDGATGTPNDDLAARCRDQQLHLYVVLPAESPWEDDLRDIAAFMTTLPPLWGAA
ncbi:MAG: VWA domain-containing protein [Chloroflexi bacterium]|nr:VWA domain-containing protein [Chloroflexota bacterium]